MTDRKALVAEIDALADKATGTPWTLKREVDPDGDGYLVLPEIGLFDDPSWFRVTNAKARDNMEFIVALVNAWPSIRRLLSEDAEDAREANPIVGHKTLRDGSHVPLRQTEANAIIAAVDAADAARKEAMPDEQSAIRAMFNGWLRLKDFGWREAMYCPKDGTEFNVLEPGSTGIHTAHYQGEWPSGSWWVHDEGDFWPSRPILYKDTAIDAAIGKEKS